MRNTLIYLIPFLLTACDSGFDPLPPVDPEVRFKIDVHALDRAIPGSIAVSGSCSVTVGGVTDEPERMIVFVDDEEVASGPGSAIEVEVPLNDVGAHAVSVECRFEDESERVERTIDVVEPAWVTVHLRNFTQDGEPFVRGDGPITFTVGDRQITSTDSVVVPVFPDGDYHVFAEHADFIPLWDRIVDHDTGELIEFRHVRDLDSPVHVAGRAAIDIFKIRVSDITSIPNETLEYGDDTSPYYTVDNLRHAIYNDREPFSGGLNRVTADKITVWAPGVDLNRVVDIRLAIARLFLYEGPDHVRTLTNGIVRSGEMIQAGATPAVRPLVEVRLDEATWHQEFVTGEGAISHAVIRLSAESDLRTAVATLLPAIGLRGKVGNDPSDDFTDANGRPSRFARLALKIVYGSPPSARF